MGSSPVGTRVVRTCQAHIRRPAGEGHPWGPNLYCLGVHTDHEGETCDDTVTLTASGGVPDGDIPVVDLTGLIQGLRAHVVRAHSSATQARALAASFDREAAYLTSLADTLRGF